MLAKLTALKLGHKIPVAVLVMVLLSISVTTVISYFSAKSEIEEQASSKLEAVLASRSSELEGYLSAIKDDLLLTASNPNTVSAAGAFYSAWKQLGSSAGDTVYALYKTDQLDNLYDAGDDSQYTVVHKKFHPWFHALQQKRGYYDVFLFDVEGDLVYSVFKEADFATNLLSGPWKDTDLGGVFRDAMKLRTDGAVTFRDFDHYKPSNDAPASFIAAPVYDNGTVVGVLAFQMPIDRINGVMQKSDGMGESGESYIVGEDKLMRSDSRFLAEGDPSSILSTKIDGETAIRALAGETGVEVIDDYRGVPVFSAFAPLKFEGVTWALLAEKDVEEVNSPIVSMRNWLVLVGIGLTLLLAGLGYLGARTITTPITATVETMNILSREGKTEIDVPYQERADELGDIAQAVEGFRLGMIEREKMRQEAEAAEKAEAERKEVEREAEEARKASEIERERAEADERAKRAQALESLVNEFNDSVTSSMEIVAAATTELEATARSMLSVAETTGTQSTSVAAAAEEASTNVQTVASASEEMAASVIEIGQQLERTNSATRQVSDQSEATSRLMEELAEASSSISAIVALINDIAEQTNLLALNATIEAARAGDAGRGFAVVASEVKTLASQTANATSQISEQVGDIQQKVADAMQATSEISDSVSSTAELTAAAAAAVEEQQATTQEITRNILEASRGTEDVSQNIAAVSQGASETAAASSQVSTTSNDMARQMEDLKRTIHDFVAGVRQL